MLLIPGCTEHLLQWGDIKDSIAGTSSPRQNWTFLFTLSKISFLSFLGVFAGKDWLWGQGCRFLCHSWSYITYITDKRLTEHRYCFQHPPGCIDPPHTAFLGRKILNNSIVLKFSSNVFGGLFSLFINFYKTSPAPKQINPFSVSFSFWNN